MADDDKVMNRIAALLTQAEHPNTSDIEREAFLAKADAMMLKHAIDEAEVRARQSPAERKKPVRVDVELYDQFTVYGQKMALLLHEVCRTVQVKLATRSGNNTVSLVGFSDDVKWAQMLFMNIHFTFLRRISPDWDKDLTPDENVFHLRDSGLSWPNINAMARKVDAYGSDDVHVVGEQIRAAYKRHCRTLGVEPTSVTRHEAYRHTYAEAFVGRVCSRLELMREARREGSTGKELVLANSWEDVLGAFFDEFPSLKPEDPEVGRKRRQQLLDEHAAWLASLSPAERLKWEKEQTRLAEKEARASDRYWRAEDKRRDAMYDSKGARAGRRAADSVDLSTAERAGHQKRQGIDE